MVRSRECYPGESGVNHCKITLNSISYTNIYLFYIVEFITELWDMWCIFDWDILIIFQWYFSSNFS